MMLIYEMSSFAIYVFCFVLWEIKYHSMWKLVIIQNIYNFLKDLKLWHANRVRNARCKCVSCIYDAQMHVMFLYDWGFNDMHFCVISTLLLRGMCVIKCLFSNSENTLMCHES